MGIREEQILCRPCRADRSLISMMYMNHNPLEMQSGFEMNRFTYNFLKEMLFKPSPKPADHPAGKKIFVLRGNIQARRELNLPEIKKALSPFGFIFLSTEGLTMQQEADLFGNADVIVAVHGAALHNLLFARPGTRVIELFPYDYFEPSNYIIASHAECDYHYMIGEPLPGSHDNLSFLERNGADIMVDSGKLLRLCRQAQAI